MPYVTVGKEDGDNGDISRRRFLVNTAGLVAVTGLPMSAEPKTKKEKET